MSRKSCSTFSVLTCSSSLNLSCVLIDQMSPFAGDALKAVSTRIERLCAALFRHASHQKLIPVAFPTWLKCQCVHVCKTTVQLYVQLIDFSKYYAVVWNGMRVADKYLRIWNTDQKRRADMQAPAQHEGLNVGAIATVDEVLQKVAEHKGCGTSGGSGKASCGSAAGQGDLPTDIWEKVKNHPCYSEEAHHHYARMHVAVAPACNIQCNYCNRKYDCANESRPGVVSEKLTPEQAAKKALAVAATIPQMTVLGIAGPGDPLANPAKTFKTFELVAAQAPDIKLCLSTNGLALPEHIGTITKFNIDHVTITINMVDPEVGAKIYPWIFYKHKRYEGIEAAKILSDHQLRGLEMLTERGILCKVNSVMIPGVNDKHLVEVNRAVKSRGAFLHNIMPLISAPEHGTVFGLTGQRGPTAQELKALQDSCEGEMNMMRHCRQCRADAVGLLGEDRSEEFTTDKIMAMEVNYDLEGRKAYQAVVEQERVAKVEAKKEEVATLKEIESDIKIL